VQARLRARLPQAGPARHPSAPGLGHKGPRAPLGPPPTDIEPPGGGEVSAPPVVTLPLGQVRDDMGHMGGAIGPGTCGPQRPYALPRGHHTRGQQPPCARAEVRVRALFRFARCSGLGGGGALQTRPPRLGLGAEDEATRRNDTWGPPVEGTQVVCLGVTVWGVAVEPIDAAMRLEVCVFPHAPETRPPQGPSATRHQRGPQGVKAPAGSGAVGRRRLTGGPRQHLQTW